jgi:hypothetical protein
MSEVPIIIILVIATISTVLLGALSEWLLKGFLPKRPKLRDIIVAIVVAIALIGVFAWASSLQLNFRSSAATPTPTCTYTPTLTPTATPTETPIPRPSARIEDFDFKFVDTKLGVFVTLINTGSTVLVASEPRSGYVYQEGEICQQGIPGTFRVAVDYTSRDHNVEYPYRWGLGRDLLPGESTKVIGYIALKTPRRDNYWVGLVQEGVQWFEKGQGPVEVTLRPPGKPMDIYEFILLLVIIGGVIGAVLWLLRSIILEVFSLLWRPYRFILNLPRRGRDIAKMKESISSHLLRGGIVCQYCLQSWSDLGYSVIPILKKYDVEYSKVRLGTFTPPKDEWNLKRFEHGIYNHLRRHFPRGKIPRDTVYYLYWIGS